MSAAEKSGLLIYASILLCADRSLLYDKSSPYKWLLELVCDDENNDIDDR